MKNFLKLFALGLIVALVFTNCKKDPVDPTVNEFEVLAQYMNDNNLDLAVINGSFAKAGSALNVDPVDFSIPGYYVIDIRQAADFEAGHIKNAVNVTLANILAEGPKAAGKPILVACYSGQTAGRAVAALRLKGYEAYTLKWGMSSWHSNFSSKWSTKVTDYASPNWVTSGTPIANVTFTTFPTLTTTETEGEKILDARINDMLANSAWSVSRDDVLATPSNYFINNYWTQAAWDLFGHINGAYRINEDLSLATLKYLDPSKTIVTYCYTGQTSSITSAWLNVMGYDAKSLSYGANAIVHSALLANPSYTKVAWGGADSGSNLNFGYYDKDGTFFDPIP
ncbi:MAG: rhodanese-like domain-containing protein [Saprospirales bacterium]|nr:rhodanese-like domain-containing protein [Saprospirales bacterium]